LTKTGGVIRSDPLAKNKDFLTGLASLLLKDVVRGQLHDQLVIDKDVLPLELNTQRIMLDVVGADIQGDLETTGPLRERVLIVAPFAATERIANPYNWMDYRRKYLVSPITPEDF